MKNKIIFISIAASILAVMAVNSALIPHLHQREALKVTQKVLELWKDTDLMKSYDFWINPQQSPPIYDLRSYQIKDKFFDKKDDKRHAQIFVVLEFGPGNVLPNSREWAFDLEETRYGWKIASFSPSLR